MLSQGLIQLFGQTCYVSLFEDWAFNDVSCLKLAISKCLGLGIVVGGSIVKIPQIVTIVRHRSAKGLSITSFLLETVAYQIVLIYNTRLYHPFSTYGEVLFMTLQNIIICLLIAHYHLQSKHTLAILALFSALFLLLWSVPSWCMALLYAAQIPIGLASKIPQIRTNYYNASTGQLSVFACLNYFIGTTARAFTTFTELDDNIMLIGNLLASFLNAVLCFQLYIYWPPTNKKIKQ
ncbi:uncharacterized protein EV154DRAFT_430364 [Mucor mucedo]|uniref:uncharacterized protein n=1 Tax=Mucor mucedo TaxID=29922 RepID=UPI00221F8C27|nr:uncharacterized protein EV154DRAFT_430364 [Mucor mucedo]KAI7874342.1 hypothetical protein EV154DRAFT_430364 [Mucor mucedo]